MPRTEFLFLSEHDMVAAGVRDAARSVDIADEVFRLLHSGDFLMGGPNRNNHGLGLVFPPTSPFPNMPVAGPDRRFVAMPAYLGGRFDVCGIKWYGSNAANPASGLPRSVLTVMLNDRGTGEPLALLAANSLSAVRTGAVVGVAVRYLVPTVPRRLAVIGCGVINRAAVAALLSQLSFTDVVCHNRSRGKAEEFARWLGDEHGLASRVADSAEEAVHGADVVTVAASRAAPLEVRSEWFTREAVILLSGPMQANDELWTQSRLVYDHIPLHHAYVADARASPDLDAAYGATMGGPLYRLIDQGRLPQLDDSEDLGAVIAAGTSPPRGRTVFISCGMAVFDVALAFGVLASARERGIGTALELWGDA
ncbi:hypothetical protein [Dactylosporangium sp. CA-233914]|uniref:hypothetical protein n=1 Tax=Dactylosporangium sp. CA-233914 TaxID=3239934 RepID=UPI003D90230B